MKTGGAIEGFATYTGYGQKMPGRFFHSWASIAITAGLLALAFVVTTGCAHIVYDQYGQQWVWDSWYSNYAPVSPGWYRSPDQWVYYPPAPGWYRFPDRWVYYPPMNPPAPYCWQWNGRQWRWDKYWKPWGANGPAIPYRPCPRVDYDG